MKTIIAGSRSINNLKYITDAVRESNFNITEIVSGTAKGVDKLGELYAFSHKIPIKKFPADWKNINVPGAIVRHNQYGPYNAVAGHMRNEQMGNYADALIAVWDGVSTGTLHMINYMETQGKLVYIHEIKSKEDTK